MKHKILILLITIILSSQFTVAQQHGFGCIRNMEMLSFSGTNKNTRVTNPVTQSIPLFGKKAKKSNRTFPLPFGVGFNSIYYDQSYEARGLRLTSDSTDITARADSLYQNTSAYEMKGTIRPNVWLFPFLNVYGIFGYTKGVISPNLVVPYIVLENVPIFDSLIVDTTFQIHDDIGYVGPTYGAGATLSLGFRYLFFMVDYNYSITNPTDLDDNLHNHFLSPKAGVFLGRSSNKLMGALWLGAMYISNDQSFSGKIDIAEINENFIPLMGEEATYHGSISAIQRWNMVVGGSLMINSHHHIMLEVGFLERKQITFGYDFRF